MTTPSRLTCPVCGHQLKLREISPRSNQIKKYPAVRPCPSCRAALRLGMPRWVIPTIIAAGAVAFLATLAALWAFGVDLSAYRVKRRIPPEAVAGILVGVAVMIPLAVWLPRSRMSVAAATAEDVARYSGN